MLNSCRRRCFLKNDVLVLVLFLLAKYNAAMPVESIKGRGATRNPTPTRFNLKERMVEGEWLDSVEALDGLPKRRTTVTIEHPKSILTRNRSPDIGFDRSVNAYRGCEHGCIYLSLIHI